MPTNSNIKFCSVCGGENFSLLWGGRSTDTSGFQSGYGVVSCNNCGVLITSPKPKTSQLDEAYSSGIYAQSGGRIQRIVNYLLTVLVHRRLKNILKFTSDKSLIDVGCGKGRFVSTALSYGWKACGYDYSKTQATAAIEKYNIEVFSGNTIAESLNGQTFDVVTCWHVLEHVDNPRVLVRQMSDALKIGGILVIEVPNAGSWQARLGRSRWFQADVPRHVHHFSYKNITSLLESENLTIKKTCTWSLELGPFGMLQTILNLLGFSPNLLFRWLKRVKGDSIFASIFCIIISLLISIPALLLELISVVFMSGGVQTVYATKNVND